jgi:hypothetical protein
MLAISPARTLASPAAQSPSPATPRAGSATPSDQGTEALARDIVNDLAARNFDKVEARYSDAVAQASPHGKLAEVWDQIGAQVGSFKSIRKVDLREAQGSRLAVLTCDFERGALAVKLAFGGDNHLVGIFFAPAEPATSLWTPPDYAHPASFREQAVAVGKDPVLLSGTLTLPTGKGPFPAVVLVHGSGPQDQDETIGPNKVFKDLAWGLSSQGIAVLRYNKRTLQYPESFKGESTVKEETTEDATAAVGLLAGRPEIAPQRIFVVGHSLGAMLAPRIAKGDPQVAGIVIMAGNTRPLEDLVVEQVKYQVGLLGKSTPEGDKAIADAEKAAADIRNPNLTASQTLNVLGAPVPGSYFLDLRAYDPAQTAASLKIPILVLQGARDCQVRMADFEGWKRALAGDPRATFHLYPNLYHLFIPVPASDTTALSTPADYQQPGHVAPEVITDISGWIQAQNGR